MLRVLATKIQDCEFVAFDTKKATFASLEEVGAELQYKVGAILT